MSRRYDLLCLDLDGTLLNKKSQISAINAKALLECLNIGMQVYFVTGRPLCFAKTLAVSVDPRINVIGYNGAYYECGETSFSQEISPQALTDFINALQQSSAHAFFKGRHLFYTHEPYDERFLYDHMNEQFPSHLQVCSYTDLSYEELLQKAEHILKILIYDMTPDNLLPLRREAESLKDLSIIPHNNISFEVAPRGINKGTAVAAVQAQLGISPLRTAAIGDALNDLVMFERAGQKIAMGNATPEVKGCCNTVTLTNTEDGVAYAVAHYLFE